MERSTLFAHARRLLPLLLGACACSLAVAQAVTISQPWARATVQGQTATGVFMTLRAAAGSRLLRASSPVAGFGQIHAMRLEGDIMKMQALQDGLELPAGQSVELKPGSYHLMLMDLKMPLKRDSTLPLSLVFVDAKGGESRVDLKVPVNTVAPVEHGHSEAVQ